MILSLGWKNVWRNKVRSMVVVIAVMLGIFGGVIGIGIMQGWMQQRMDSNIKNEISHIQIHHPDFINNEELNLTINNYDKVIGTLDSITAITAYSGRLKTFAMVQSDWGSTGIVLKGVDPEKEKLVTELHLNIVEGEYLGKDYRMPSIVIGSKMAETLKLKNYEITQEKLDSIQFMELPQAIIEKLNKIEKKRFRKEKDFKKALTETLNAHEMKKHESRLIKYFSFYRLRSRLRVTIVDTTGKIEMPVFRVRGIYKTSNTMFDGLNAFVDKEVLNEFTHLGKNEIHEIAIISSDNETGHIIGERLESYLPANSVMSWKKISPELAMFADFGKLFNYIIIGIILLALAFGIINTMLMSVLERVKELGMLMAIGMNKKKVFRMIMLESVFLSLTGAALGMLISGITIKILGRTGIDFSQWADGFEAMGIASVVYPVITWDNFLGITMLVIITGVIASFWPARKALKLNPCEALRTE